jgi:F0F1-type ATP synthase assembly protein I
MGLCVAIGAGAGYLVDKRLGSTPVFLVVGFLLGAVAAFRELFRAAGGKRQGAKRQE